MFLAQTQAPQTKSWKYLEEAQYGFDFFENLYSTSLRDNNVYFGNRIDKILIKGI